MVESTEEDIKEFAEDLYYHGNEGWTDEEIEEYSKKYQEELETCELIEIGSEQDK